MSTWPRLRPPPHTNTHTTHKKKMIKILCESTRTGKKNKKKNMRAHKRDRARLKLPPLQLFQTCTPVGPDGGTTLACDAGRSSSRRRRRASENKDSVGRCECAVSTERPDQLSLCVLTGIEAGGWRGRVGCLRASYYRHHSPPNWRAREQQGWSGIIFAKSETIDGRI